MKEHAELVVNEARVVGLTEVLARREDLPDVPDFRLASYNVHNLFGDAPDVHSARPGPPAPNEQLSALAAVIRSLDVDAIAFQEVQNEKVLIDLFKRINRGLDSANRFTSFVCIPARDPRGINVALATRFAVRATLTFHDREFGPDERATRFSRDLLGVELYATRTYRFLFFAAHLKSQIGGEPAATKRRLEAKEIREILEEPVFGGLPYIEQPMILAGDMNDQPDSATFDILRGQAPKVLRDLLAELPDDHTYPTHNRYPNQRLDYLLASSSLKIGDPGILREHARLAEASDHYPVSATVQVPN